MDLILSILIYRQGIVEVRFKATAGSVEKRDTLHGNCEEQVSKSKDQHHNVFQVNPSGGYRLRGTVNGTPTTFLMDTGAAVTLVRDDVWQQTATASKQLEPWDWLSASKC